MHLNVHLCRLPIMLCTSKETERTIYVSHKEIINRIKLLYLLFIINVFYLIYYL